MGQVGKCGFSERDQRIRSRGIRDLNLALLSKWKWLYKTKPEALWVKVICAIHKQSRTHKQFPNNLDFKSTWNSIINSRTDLEKENVDLCRLMKVKVGRGNSALFWLDNWIGDGPLKVSCPDLYRIERNKGCKIGDRIVNGQNGMEWSWNWIRSPALGNETEQFQLMHRLLCDFVPSQDDDK